MTASLANTELERLLNVVKAAGRDGIAPRACIAPLYGNRPDGGPDWARSCICVMAYNLRKRGLIVSRGKTWGAKYYASEDRHGASA